MIHVLCLNPAVDKIFRIDGFAAGEDYPGQTPKVFGGGKGVNVARVASQLGAQVTLYAFMCETGGDMIVREMQERCACVFVTLPGACRTTINIIDSENGRETVITEAGPAVSQEHVQRLMEELRARVQPGDIVCCSGSVIAGAPKDIYAQVSRLSEALGARCVLDCNAKALPASLAGARYALVKPNERELAALLDMPRTQDEGEIVAMARRLMPGCGMLLVSMGAQGGILVLPDGAYRARIPHTDVVSTVGSGDSCLAGALYALSQGMEMEQVLRLAMACGVVNARRGGNGSVERQEAQRMMQNIQIEKTEWIRV